MTTIALRRRLAELDTQIAEHRRELRELEEARTAVERELHAIPFPVLKLPAEITAEIFTHCLPWFIHLDPDEAIDESPDIAPRVFTRVCRTWRDIALTTPRLWSTLAMIFESIPPQAISNPRSVEGFIDRWLARAGQCPLSLVFRDEGLEVELVHQVLGNVLRRYSHRLHYLELYIAEGPLLQLGLGSLTFPLLESVSLDLWVKEADTQTVSIFENAPLLHEFHLYSEFPVSSSTRFALPWLQLTKYDGVVKDLQFFALVPNLTEATCSGYIYRAGSLLTHARLTSLTVKEGTYEILRSLTLPALQHLNISWEEACDELDTFLDRSSPPLISLFVIPIEDEDFDWAQCLAHVARTLENLHFISPSPENTAFFLDLSPSSLPNIRTLALERVNPRSGIDYHRLVRFLYSWSSDSYHLRSFRLHWKDTPFFDAEYHPSGYRDDGPVDTIGEHLSRLARAGMDIYLGTEVKNYAPVHGQIQNSGGGDVEPYK
ncbi:hypothetical protein K438DRAFT_1859426 [Mycena galopus ATCC 62051]|nr:hypothetical protein K438DRAFT_1859426 [Mycena galopus ATCC 62051]